MAKRYLTISRFAELELQLSACDCDGYDIVKQLRKEERYASEFAACLCGRVRARRSPQGQWSVVVDETSLCPLPKAMFGRDFSVTGQPDR